MRAIIPTFFTIIIIIIIIISLNQLYGEKSPGLRMEELSSFIFYYYYYCYYYFSKCIIPNGT